MNRFLLTLLALMTGLAAQVSPAQAALRAADEAEVGSVQTVRAAVRLARQVAVVAAATGVAHEPRLGEASPLIRVVALAPAVRIGIDRARQ